MCPVPRDFQPVPHQVQQKLRLALTVTEVCRSVLISKNEINSFISNGFHPCWVHFKSESALTGRRSAAHSLSHLIDRFLSRISCRRRSVFRRHRSRCLDCDCFLFHQPISHSRFPTADFARRPLLRSEGRSATVVDLLLSLPNTLAGPNSSSVNQPLPGRQ